MKKKNLILIMAIVVFLLITSVVIIMAEYLRMERVELKTGSADKKSQEAGETGTTQIWDISAAENDHVIATLTEDGTLTISGTGNMKNWYYDSKTEWLSDENKSKLKKLVIEEGVTNMGNYAFYECIGLSGSLEIPNSVTNIGNSAFKGCSGLSGSLTIGNSVTNIGNSAFKGCSGITKIEVSEENNSYSSEEGILFNKAQTEIISCPEGKIKENIVIPESVISIGNYAFYICTGLNGNLKIPYS